MTPVARALLGALTGLALTAPLASAQQPRSAIPWLSDSIEPTAPVAPRPRPGGHTPVPGDATITVTPLGDVNLDAVGLLTSQQTGLPRVLWGDIPAGTVRDFLLDHKDRGVPEARALFREILLAEADPPPPDAAPATDVAGVLIARLDRLLALGALEETEALIRAAGPETPEIFRRWFDIGLLTGRSEDQCAALKENAALSPTLPARVFCLARGGDWNAAEITLTLGEGVGSITPDQEALLARFLDPVLFEEDPEPPIPSPLTALDFTLREAVGLPRPPGTMPLAFLWGDLSEHAPMRQRITAGERLVRAGTVPATTLFEAYRAGVPAASGGVWDRARAVQALDAALADGKPLAISEALAAADPVFTERDLRFALAEAYAPALAALGPPDPSQGDRVAEFLLLAGDVDAAVIAAGATPSPHMAELLAVAGARPAPGAIADDRLAAALRGLSDRPPAGDRESLAVADIAAGRTGAVILDALDLLGGGTAIDPAALDSALFALNAAGQRDAARAVALQTLLLSGDD